MFQRMRICGYLQRDASSAQHMTALYYPESILSCLNLCLNSICFVSHCMCITKTVFTTRRTFWNSKNGKEEYKINSPDGHPCCARRPCDPPTTVCRTNAQASRSRSPPIYLIFIFDGKWWLINRRISRGKLNNAVKNLPQTPGEYLRPSLSTVQMYSDVIRLWHFDFSINRAWA